MENARIAFTVVKLSFFLALGVITFLAVKQPAGVQQDAAESSAEAMHSGAAAEAASDDVVVAIVNGQMVYRSQLMNSYDQLPVQAQQMGMEVVYPMLLERVIDEKLLAVAANKEVSASDPEVVKQVAELRSRVMMQVYFTRILEKKLTDERLQESYRQYLAANPSQEEVRARHILVESQEEAIEILAEIQSGKDFAEAAKEHSTGPSGPNGGDLGYFTAGAMVQPFSEAAFAMESGAVSPQPVQTDFGWHLIKVEDRRNQPQPAFEEMREQLAQEMSQAAASEILGELRIDAVIEKFDFEGQAMPSSEGG